MFTSNPYSCHFFQPVCSEEFYRNIPVCSDNKGQVMFPTITTWSWGTGPQPCKGHLEQSPCCTRHLSRESTQCFKMGTCVSFLNRRPGPNPAEKSNYWAVSQSSGQEDTYSDTATSDSSISIPTGAPIPKNGRALSPATLQKAKGQKASSSLPDRSDG